MMATGCLTIDCMTEDKPHSTLFGVLSQTLLSKGLGFRFQARGRSMQPAIRDGEILHVQPVTLKELSEGDIVLFASGANYTAHRLILADCAQDVFITKGDAGAEKDGILQGREILGKVVAKEENSGGRIRVVPFCGVRARMRRFGAQVRTIGSRGLRRAVGQRSTASLRNLIFSKVFSINLGIVLLLAFSISPSVLLGQVAVDATTSVGARLTNAAPTLTFNHVTTAIGTNVVLVVGVSIDITNNTTAGVSGVTYNAVALTKAGFLIDAGNSRRVEIWYLIAPLIGTNAVAVTLNFPGGGGTLGVYAGATTFTGADQTSPIRSFASASGATGTIASVNVPSAVNDMVIDVLAIGGNRTVANPAGFGTTQVPQWDGVSNAALSGTTDVIGTGSTRTGAANVPLSETFNGTSNWAVAAVSVRPLQADLAVSITGSSALYPANFAYTITVTNNGPSATIATLTDTLPSGLTLVTSVPSAGTCAGATTIICALGTIAPSASVTVTLTVSPGATGGYPDTASVVGTVADSNNANNSATGLGFSQANTCTTPTSTNAPAALTGILNTYYPGTASVTTGATSITVGTSTGATTPIAIGDLLLVIQMQNANINSPNTSLYGDGATGSGSTNLNNSGVYEFVTAASALAVGGGTVSVSGAGPGGGLLYSYTSSAATATQGQFTFQVVRVPHYATATLGTALTASAWNGSTGGVVSIDLEGALTLGGHTVSADGLGFRGGAGLALTGGTGTNTDFRLTSPTTYTGVKEAGAHGSKGEGIAGTPFWVESGNTYLSTTIDGYPNGSMARGAPGNAGGGGTDADPQTASPNGNDENAGGGGGGNGGSGGTGGNAWQANLSSGGLGGTAFPATITRISLGGGGGAGSRNNDTATDNPVPTAAQIAQSSSGSAGGGIVIIRVGSLTGTGTISANGVAAYNNTLNDAGGGGGAGGSIIILSAAGGESGLTLSASGGRGGDAWDTNAFTLANRHGPGGGGGGGVILVSGTPASVSVTGGANGVTETPGVPYGATTGASGITATNATLASSPGPNSAAVPCTDISITKTASPNPVREGQTLTYTLVVTNNGPTAATGVTVTDPLPTTDVTYVSSTTTVGTCTFAVVTVTCPIGNLAIAQSATITIKVTATTPSQAVNTASVSESQADSLFSNNFATQSELIETPTGVKLESFTAGATSVGALLSWKTGGELRNLGFNVYREVNGQRVRLNPSLIAGSALIMRHALEQHGAKTYTWIDRSPGANNSLYWLEDVDLNGTRTFHGPISPQEDSSALGATQALMIQELNSPDSVAGNSSASEIIEAVAQVGASTSQQQQMQFQLAARPAVKIFVRHEGWYRITQPQLVAAGLSASVDPSLLRLFAEGVEQPLRIVGAGPGSGGFGPQAAVEFYGTGIDTFYSDKRVYWLVAGSQPGLRIAQQGYEAGGPQPQSFPRTVALNQRTTYFAALLKENTDNFFGALVSPAPIDQLLNVANIASAMTGNASLRVVLQGVTEDQAHDVTIAMNGSTLGELNFTGQNEGSITLQVPAGVLRPGANSVTLTAQNGENDLSLVNFITLTYPHTYTAEADSLKFTAEAGDHVVVNGFRQTPTLLVDITNPAQPVELAIQVLSEKGKYALQAKVPWSTSGLHTLLAVSDNRITAPFELMRNNPSSWHSAQPGSEVVMISYPEFAGQLAPLSQLHRAEGKTVSIISVNDLYDEFNFGERSPYAIRSFLQTATTQWKSAPKYLLLMGDASLDPRNYLRLGFFDFVPTKIIVTSELKTASDDWFSDFNNTGFAQIATGRLPVRTLDDANTVVGKIAGYASSQAGSWTNQTLMVADRDDTINFTEESQSVQKLLPKSMKILDIFAGNMDASSAKQQIIADINNGDLLVNYSGHGSVEVWSGDNLFDDASATSLTNGARLPVFLIMNCLNGFFQDVYTESLAESLLLAKNGGAVAVWASSGLNQAAPQAQMDRVMVGLLFTQPSPALGDAVNQAKSGIADADVRRTYILFGDPLLRLKWPASANNVH
jgi:uncharacterized repeat protein (TIGR01451 family)